MATYTIIKTANFYGQPYEVRRESATHKDGYIVVDTAATKCAAQRKLLAIIGSSNAPAAATVAPDTFTGVLLTKAPIHTPTGAHNMIKLVNGTAYNVTSPNDLIAALESARVSGQRVRIFYGDNVTGCTWNEENDVTGTIGRSTGEQKIPLLINNKRSMGGGAVLTACIVHMIDVKTKRVLYTHRLFKMPQAQIVANTAACWPRSQPAQYTHAVKLDGVLHAFFTSVTSATRYAAFMTGLRGAK